MKESSISKLKRLSFDVDKNISASLSPIEKVGIFLDFISEKIFHNVELIDYIQYGYYWKKRRERRRFIDHGKLLKIMKICNNPEHRYIFDEKPEFNKSFSKYLGRDWIYLEDDAYEEFLKFIKNKKKIFVKDPTGTFGRGVDCIKTDGINPLEVYNKLKNEKVLCEEVLTQCSEIKEFNETAVNTMRVVTLICADGTVKIMAGVMRLSRKGKIADNFHHHGIAALIDVETGIVKTTGVDRDFKRYVVHPDSKKTIVGFQVPMWDKVKETVKKVALVYPDMRYIGWDVLINENNEVVIIEGNPGADPDVTQIPDQIGKWPLFEKELSKLK